MTKNINIREFDKEKDYPALIALMNALYVGSDHTEEEIRGDDEEMRGDDEDNPNQVAWGRFLAERNGEVVGNARYWQDKNNPQKFWVNLHCADNNVLEAGEGLYQALSKAIAPYNPIEIEIGTDAHEEMVGRTGFLQKQGFVEVKRNWNVRLNVKNFAPDVLHTFQGVADKVTASGINIYSYAQLIRDPDREQKLYELYCTIDEVVHHQHFMRYTAPSLEKFKKDFLEDNTHFIPDACFIAVDTNSDTRKYVGLSVLYKPSEGDHRDVHLTGVLPAYQKRGIASALKLHGVLYAKDNNIPTIRTWGASKAMLALNKKMGFVQEGQVWLTFKKEI
jgi:RimJ/RimL family protein N-acetyltransferase